MTVLSLSGKANTLYKAYFHPLADAPCFSERNKKAKAKVVAIVTSYFTIIIPAIVIAVFAAMKFLSLIGGCFKNAPAPTAKDLYDSSGNLNLARLYEKDEYNEMYDKKKALHHYIVAADNHNAKAQLRLAKAYECGELDCSQDKKKAFNYYLKAADQGLMDAQLRLAKAYELGQLGCRQDLKKALEYHIEAANSIKYPAEERVRLARAYEFGNDLGCEIDNKKALDHYTIAAANHSGVAQTRLGKVYEFGELGCSKDFDKANTYQGNKVT